ncbi:hypothetical protein PAMC26577_08245 [Caballeronia sordidicola]|uniref:Uncharacterized protein n=1 Tax=Caballeronia sordidicola TaxID=196367 RepID=A0A242N223_CABSO|nr:hypothetical protein PAMC26577_08245 [Caballeronia sordidicola]
MHYRYREAMALQEFPHEVAHYGVVVDEKNVLGHAAILRRAI